MTLLQIEGNQHEKGSREFRLAFKVGSTLSLERSRKHILKLSFLLVSILVAALAGAQSPSTAYTVALTSADQHLLDVQVTVSAGSAHRELQLPVWNALYQIRDFAQYVNWIRARDGSGKPLPLRETGKSHWQLDDAQDGAIIEYQIYVDSPGPFGAQLNSHHAFLNLAQILVYEVALRNAPMSLHFTQVPKGWQIATPLRASKEMFEADNYDRLVDSPVEIGDFHEYDFDESGAHFRVIIDADPTDYDANKVVADVHKIVGTAINWMSDRPFDTYMFIYHFPRGPAGGGMEHAYSTAIELNADSIKQSLYPLTAVTAHEFFHLWNVKRIRPQTLEPVDYTKENFSRALWFSEGCTSTAEDFIQLRAALIDEKQFLANLGEQISELEHRPARLTQSAEQSSLDAWLEGYSYYRRPERSVSYYNKGELLGLMLDLTLREQSRGQVSLRELFQWMNANYAKQGRYFDDSTGVRTAAEALTHADFSAFFARYVAGTDELPWNDFLRPVGLQVETQTTIIPDPGFLASRSFDSPMTVVSLSPGGEAEGAGLREGDIITELQGKAVGQESRQDLARLQPGDTITAKVRSRRGERELKWKIAGRQEVTYEVKDLDHITPEQRARRAAWLKGEAQTAQSATPDTVQATHPSGID